MRRRSAGVQRETVFDWDATPTQPDQTDGGVDLTLGVKFTLSVARECNGIEFWVPSTLPTGPSPAFVSVWDAAGAGTLLQAKAFEWSAYASLTNTLQRVLFDNPEPLSSGVEYMAAVQSFQKSGFTPAWTWPFTTGVLTAVANNGWVRLTYGFPNVESPSDANYFVSPVIAP